MADYLVSKVRKASMTGTAAAVGQVVDMDGATAFGFQISGLATETIGVTLSNDNGTTYSAAIKPMDAVTGVLAATATLGNGIYYLPLGAVCNAIKFTKSATADTVLISFTAIF